MESSHSPTQSKMVYALSRMKLTGINQLWVADITYIRLQREFVFLAVILGGFSRKVVG
jgi:putative transposase